MATNRIGLFERDWFAFLVLHGLATEADAVAARRRLQETAWDEYRRLQDRAKKRPKGRGEGGCGK